MELTILIEMLFGLFFVLLIRGVYVMAGLFNGLQSLSNYTDEDLIVRAVRMRDLKRKAIEGTIHMMAIASIGFSMYLIAVS